MKKWNSPEVFELKIGETAWLDDLFDDWDDWDDWDDHDHCGHHKPSCHKPGHNHPWNPFPGIGGEEAIDSLS